MKTKLVFTVFFLFSAFALATNVERNTSVAQLILKDPSIMAAVAAKVKSILPKLKMKLTNIEVNSSPSKYSAVMTYTDTARDTFFNPSFGDLSVLVRGKITSNTSVTADTIVEYGGGE